MSLAWRFEDGKELAYIKEVLDSGFASGTCGNMNTRLEQAFAEKMDRKFAITFNSGTTTLHAALRACGVGYGDEVILPALTVISCMNAVLYCNAIPVFADIDADTFLISPESIRSKITERTKAIMPVHLYGQPCNMTEIMKIASEYNLKVIEDNAQCFMGRHKTKLAGTFGDVASWSFENSKHMTVGDGGIICCDSEVLGDKIRRLNSQGYKNATAVSGKIRVAKIDWQRDPNYQRHSELGYMYRLPEVAAAMGLAQLEKLDSFVEKRVKMASMYSQVLFAQTDAHKWLMPQHVPIEDFNSYYTYACKFDRDDITRKQFCEKYYENGGDGIYAAWVPLYREASIDDCKRYLTEIGLGDRINTFDTVCPVVDETQPKLMQFTTNQANVHEMEKQAEALYKTVLYFS